MTEPVSAALLVMAVGMITVFIILGLVVLSGDLLIRAVNTFVPAKPAPRPNTRQATPSPASQVHPSSTVSRQQVAAIVTAVDLLTRGKGKPERIERID